MSCFPRTFVRLLLALILAASGTRSRAIDWQVGTGRWSSGVGLQANLSKSSSSGTSSSSSTSYGLNESFDMQGSGLYLLDRRLVNGSMGFTIAFNQFNYSGAGAVSASDAMVTNYNLNASILERKSYPIELYASLTQIDANLDYGRRSVGSIDNQGFRVRLSEDSDLKKWVGPWFTAQLEVRQEHRQQTTTSFNRISYLDQTSRTVNASAQKGFPTADLNLRYRGADQSSGTPTQDGSRSQAASIDYDLDFGPGLNRKLTSSLVYATRNALLASNTLTLNEDLHIDHYRNLTTDYAYDFTRDEGEGEVALNHFASFSLWHQLYENLSTDLTMEAQRSDFVVGTLSRHNGRLSQNYYHSLPGGGALNLGWHGSYEHSGSALSVGRINAKDQFNAIDPANADTTQRLSKPFIIESSIRVFNLRDDPNESELVRDRDYTVEVIRNLTYITPIYRDTLPNDDPVEPGDLLKVTYEYELDGDREIESYGAGYGTSVSYGWIGVNYSHNKTNSKLLGGRTRFAQNNSSDEITDTYGVNLNFGWIGANYIHSQTESLLVSDVDRILLNSTLQLQNSSDDSVNIYMNGNVLGLATSAEASHMRSSTRSLLLDVQEDTSRVNVQGSGRFFGVNAKGSANFVRYRGTLVNAYDRAQLMASLYWKPRERWNMNASASASNAHYLKTDRQFALFTARTSLDWQTDGGWNNNAMAEVRTEQNDISPRSVLMQLQAKTQLKLGKLYLALGVSVGQSVSGNLRQNQQNLFLSIRRNL